MTKIELRKLHQFVAHRFLNNDKPSLLFASLPEALLMPIVINAESRPHPVPHDPRDVSFVFLYAHVFTSPFIYIHCFNYSHAGGHTLVANLFIISSSNCAAATTGSTGYFILNSELHNRFKEQGTTSMSSYF